MTPIDQLAFLQADQRKHNVTDYRWISVEEARSLGCSSLLDPNAPWRDSKDRLIGAMSRQEALEARKAERAARAAEKAERIAARKAERAAKEAQKAEQAAEKAAKREAAHIAQLELIRAVGLDPDPGKVVAERYGITVNCVYSYRKQYRVSLGPTELEEERGILVVNHDSHSPL